MVYTYDYNSIEYEPAMPVVELRLGRAFTTPYLELMAIVDSGADATIVPVRYLRQLQARRGRRNWMRGTIGEREIVYMYPVALQLGPLSLGRVEVVGNVTNNEVIVGRDVLNQLEITLNGLSYTVLIAGL
jgi:hypothetical protein